MLIYDIEDLIHRAKKHYGILKDQELTTEVSQELQELNSLLFTDATAVNINNLEEWLDVKDSND